MATKVGKVLGVSKALKELRIHFCPNSQSSSGVRSFIKEHYVSVKKSIPSTPILVREAENIEPMLWARYEFGQEHNVSLKNLNSSSILSYVNQMIGK